MPTSAVLVRGRSTRDVPSQSIHHPTLVQPCSCVLVMIALSVRELPPRPAVCCSAARPVSARTVSSAWTGKRRLLLERTRALETSILLRLLFMSPVPNAPFLASVVWLSRKRAGGSGPGLELSQTVW